MCSKAEVPLDPRARTVLVVDDDDIVRSAVAEFLRECGFFVVEAANAVEAMSVFDGGTFAVDVLFTDVQMPGAIDGFGLARWVRANSPGAKIIITSGATRNADDADDLCGYGPFIAKPYASADIEQRIRQLLAMPDQPTS